MKDILSALFSAVLPYALPGFLALFCFFSTYQCERISQLEYDVMRYRKAIEANRKQTILKQHEERKIKHDYENLLNELSLIYAADTLEAGPWGNTLLPASLVSFLRNGNRFSGCAPRAAEND